MEAADRFTQWWFLGLLVVAIVVNSSLYERRHRIGSWYEASMLFAVATTLLGVFTGIPLIWVIGLWSVIAVSAAAAVVYLVRIRKNAGRDPRT